MKDNQVVPFFGTPPREYDAFFFARLLRDLEIHLRTLHEVGPIRVSGINISNLPTSSVGLRSGDLWSDAGTVKIVP